MKTMCSLLLALVLAAGCAPKVDDPADVAAVKATMEAFTKAINAKDTAAAVASLTEKTTWLESHLPAMVGKDAVAKLLGRIFTQYTSFDLATTVADVRVAGDLAVMRGTYTEVDVPAAGHLTTSRPSGSWMITLTRQPDRSWKWDTFIVNSDQPMPGTTADGAEEQAIVKIEQDWIAALAKPDLAFLDRTLAREYMDAADGEAISKAQLLAAFKSGAFKFESMKLRDLDVHVFGYVAIATSTVDVKASYLGKAVAPLQRSTDIFVKRDGQWQPVSTQNVTIK